MGRAKQMVPWTLIIEEHHHIHRAACKATEVLERGLRELGGMIASL